jgi:hypothetical protein
MSADCQIRFFFVGCTRTRARAHTHTHTHTRLCAGLGDSVRELSLPLFQHEHVCAYDERRRKRGKLCGGALIVTDAEMLLALL